MSLLARSLPAIRHRLSYFPEAVAVISFVLLFIFFSIAAPNFLTALSFGNILTFGAIIGIVTVGVAMLMIAGEFDLSVGSNFAVASYVLALTLIAGWPVWAGMLLAVVVSTGLGLLNGLIVTKARIPSFIATLGTKYFYRGMLWVISGGAMLQTVSKPGVYNVFNGRFDLLNNLFSDANFRTSLLWQLALVIVFQTLLTHTKFGNHVFAVGGNKGAALGQGVNVSRVKITNFVITSAIAGFTGVLLFSQYYTVRVASGDGLELSAIAACVVGGVLITGGAGSIWGALIGALTISMLRTGVVLMNIPFIPADNFEAIVGVTIILAVILNNYLRHRT